MLGVTRFTWVTVAMSTQLGDRHRFGSLWVAFFVCRVWVLGIGLQAGCQSWLHNALARVGATCGWLGTRVGCHWHPPGHLYFGHFLPFLLMGLYSPRVSATQPSTDFPRWTGFCTNMKYWCMQNPKVGENNICIYTYKLCLWPWLLHIRGSTPQWEMLTIRPR